MNLTIRRSDASYEILVRRGILQEAGKQLDFGRKILVVTDSGIPRAYVQSLLSQCKEPTLVTIPAGEEYKTFTTYETIVRACLAAGLTRSDCIVALGGGTVGDLAGFAGATYLRGIDFYNIPTTLLAMADASVGGKTGLNLEGYKNQVGAFYQPAKVLVDPDLLATLDARLFACGYVEILKEALTLDADLFYRMEDGSAPVDELIRRSIELKASVVSQDEREGNLRRVLNFGHTIGHGIESAAGGALLHGECVSLGMIPMCAPALQKRLAPILASKGLPTHYDGDPEQVVSAILHDKKRTGNTVTVVLVEAPGTYELRKVSLQSLEKFVRNAPIFAKEEGSNS